MIFLDLALHLWPAIAIPAGFLLLVRPVGRLVFALVGILLFFAIGAAIGPQGPDSYGLILPFYGLALSVGAVVAEALARLGALIRAVSRRQRKRSD